MSRNYSVPISAGFPYEEAQQHRYEAAGVERNSFDTAFCLRGFGTGTLDIREVKVHE
jgi:hypothetical protein